MRGEVARRNVGKIAHTDIETEPVAVDRSQRQLAHVAYQHVGAQRVRRRELAVNRGTRLIGPRRDHRVRAVGVARCRRQRSGLGVSGVGGNFDLFNLTRSPRGAGFGLSVILLPEAPVAGVCRNTRDLVLGARFDQNRKVCR